MNELNQTELDRILKIISEITEKSANDDYIYRGEAREYNMACSGLYRAYVEGEVGNPDVVGSQESILDKIEEYLPEVKKSPPSEILAHLQHFGAKTNLIDFTTNYLIALYFACEKEYGVDGQILILERESEKYEVMEAPETIPRAVSQQSVFVQSPNGFIEACRKVNIPYYLKESIIIYLKKYHSINEGRIYNDIHGFIKSADTATHHLEIHKGKRMKEMWEELRRRASRRGNTSAEQDILNMIEPAAFNKVVYHYTTAMGLERECLEAYIEICKVYALKHDYDSCIEYYNEAIKLYPNNADLYSYRGKIYYYKNDLDRAIEDYNRAIARWAMNAYFYYERCAIFMKQKNWDRVKADIIHLKELFKENTLRKKLAEYAEEEGIKLPGDIRRLLEEANEDAG